MWLVSLACTTIFFQVAIGGSSGYTTGPSVVDLGYARYQGVVSPTTQNTEFLGIRYAAPPIGTLLALSLCQTLKLTSLDSCLGNLRWKAPQTPRRDTRLQVANTQPNRCHQAFPGTNPRNPIQDGLVSSNGTSTSAAVTLGSRQVSEPVESEDCLFLKYVSLCPTQYSYS